MSRTKLLLSAVALMLATLVSAQPLTKVKAEYDLEGCSVLQEVLPDYYPEKGTVSFRVDVTPLGEVIFASIDSSRTTVFEGNQVRSARDAAYSTRVLTEWSRADTLKGHISYIVEPFTKEEQEQLNNIRLWQIQQSVKALPQEPVGYYVLYPTDNMYTFIELDSATGKLWQVQYSTKGDDYRFKTLISWVDRREKGNNTYTPGRFVLYKTQNMYNFIMVDSLTGRTWQVQWSMDYDNRMVLPIE